MIILFFFFNDTATTEIYTLSLHDALPIFAHLLAVEADHRRVHVGPRERLGGGQRLGVHRGELVVREHQVAAARSEEHTSELQSRQYLVCRLLLEKKKQQNIMQTPPLPSLY